MRRLLLIGAGHAHLSVLRALRAEPPAGVEITLVTPWPRQVYSGMLPGWIAGHYALDDCVIPLAPLLAGVPIRWLTGTVSALDLARRSARTADGTHIDFDLVSIDTGAMAALDDLPGARDHAQAIRPIERFIERWPQWLADCEARAADRPVLTVVGGGAAGVEIALAMAWRMRTLPGGRIQLVTGGSGLLPGFPERARQLLRAQLGRSAVEVIADQVIALEAAAVRLAQRGALRSDRTLLVTGTAAAAWPREAGLAVDAAGFIAIDPTRRSTSHPFVFAGGDCASVVGHPRPRSGVYAVRAGPVLADNLRRTLRGEPLRAVVPQRRALYILAAGRRSAVACWGPWTLAGDWVWRWKDRIDRRFIAYAQCC